MNPRHVPHRIERTRNKHSRAVLRDGTVVIRLARNLSTTEEHEHISELLRRMAKHVLEERQKTVISPFKHVLSGGQCVTVTLATGKKYLFTMRPGKRTSARRTSTGWIVTVGPGTRRAGLHRFLWSLLARTEKARIEALVQKINEETFDVRIRSVRFCFASSQWGSCSPRGIIMINAALLFVPPSMLRYIIVHELAHRKRADHSQAFWNWVEWGMPTYAPARDALHEFRLPGL